MNNITSFFSTTFGVDLAPKVRVSRPAPLNLTKKRNRMNIRLLKLYNLQMKSTNVQKIDWDSVDVKGWPRDFGKDVKFLTKVQLKIMNRLLNRGIIVFKPKNQ